MGTELDLYFKQNILTRGDYGSTRVTVNNSVRKVLVVSSQEIMVTWIKSEQRRWRYTDGLEYILQVDFTKIDDWMWVMRTGKRWERFLGL